jgi:hypothetical protein
MMLIIGFLACATAAYVSIDKYVAFQNAALKSVFALLSAAVISSIFFCFFLFLGLGFLPFTIFLIVSAAAYLFIAVKKQGYRFRGWNIERFSFPVLLVILCGLCYFSYSFFNIVVRWGEWDGWAIWSQHARFLMSGTSFNNLFVEATHPDYPLFLSSLIAMFWHVSYSAFVPALIAYLVAISLLLVIVTSFLERGHYFFGLSVFLILATSDVFFPFVTSQCADTLIAIFIVVTFVLHNQMPTERQSGQLFLLGFFAASCGWIKNEGLTFFVLFSVCFAIKYFRLRDWLKWYVLGSLLPLAMILSFKLWYAPANDLVNTNEANYASRFVDTEKYKVILDYMYLYLKDNCGLLYYSLGCILLLRYRFALSFGFIVICLLFSAYFFAYVVSPYDLTWHLSTSFSRLVHQIFPALIYLIYFAAAEKFSKSRLNFRFGTSLKV